MSRGAIVAGVVLLAALVLGRLLAPAFPLLAAETSPARVAASSTSGAEKGGQGDDAARPAADETADGDTAPAADGTETTGEAPGSPYAGDEACEVCHEEIFAAAKRSPHVQEASPSWAGRTCEGCHGPGQAHVDAGGGTDNVRGLVRAPATEMAQACLACHGGDPHLRGVRSGEHVLADVSCSGCHEPHGRGVGAMLRKPEAQLCMSCHLDVRAAYAMPYRHGPRQGRVECDDCHDPHGTRNAAMMKAPDDRTCFTCHADLQGPWVFEHVGLVTEGCRSCHVPHGSSNRHLLRYQQVAQLCYQCHTLTPPNHRQPSYRDCTRCHVWVHGSNTDPRFLEP